MFVQRIWLTSSISSTNFQNKRMTLYCLGAGLRYFLESHPTAVHSIRQIITDSVSGVFVISEVWEEMRRESACPSACIGFIVVGARVAVCDRVNSKRIPIYISHACKRIHRIRCSLVRLV